MSGPVERLYRRALMMIGVGRVLTGTDTGNAGFLQVRLNDRETLDGQMTSQHYGFSSSAKPGADAVILFMSGDRSKGIVVATGDQRYRFELENGEVSIWDDQGQKVHLQRTGITLKDKSGNTIVTTSTGVLHTDVSGSTIAMANNTITMAPKNQVLNVSGEVSATGNGSTGGSLKGDLNVIGKITATGDIVAGYGTDDQISLLGHLHTSEAPGTPTSAPIAST